jgi:hypothetical protein
MGRKANMRFAISSIAVTVWKPVTDLVRSEAEDAGDELDEWRRIIVFNRIGCWSGQL